MLTKRSFLLAKAEFFLGRTLTIDEKKLLYKKAQDGTQQTIKETLSISKNRKHIPLGIIIEKYIPRMDKMSTEDLIGIVKEVLIKSTSVDSGMKILRKALSKNRDSLIGYLLNLWFRDAKNSDYYKKAYEGSYLMEMENHFSNVDPYSRESGALKTIQPMNPAVVTYELDTNGYPKEVNTEGNRAIREEKNEKKKTDKEVKVLIEFKKSIPGGDNVMTNNYSDIYDDTENKKNEDH